MAKLWSLPVVYVIENNQYGMGTSVKRASRPRICANAVFPSTFPASRWTDGRAGGKAAGERALDHARSGNGPMILK
jgi:pyruvate dehydrogenase E1 component alpha subunit